MKLMSEIIAKTIEVNENKRPDTKLVSATIFEFIKND